MLRMCRIPAVTRCLAVLIQVLAFASPAAADVPVTASIDTALETASGQIRQFAFDGDKTTFFASKQNPGADDHFTVVFDKPVAVKSVAVATGRPDGSDRLDAGRLEVSEDGQTFEMLALFAEGASHGELRGRKIRALRIRPEADLAHPLAIGEISIESEPPVACFKYPIEFNVDVSDAPELGDWANRVARICERAYPMINEELKSEGFKPPHQVTMTLKNSYKGVAEAGGGRITGSVKYFTDHPDDVGAMVHETAHIVQNYRRRGNPGWLVEGVADYVRFFKFEPGNLGRIDAQKAHYNSSYRVSAAFLAYVTGKYDKDLVLKLNKLMRDGNYRDEIFKDLTGKTLEELDEEWRATLVRQAP